MIKTLEKKAEKKPIVLTDETPESTVREKQQTLVVELYGFTEEDYQFMVDYYRKNIADPVKAE